MPNTVELNPDLEKVKTLAIKIKQLVDKGVDGEKSSAEKKLKSLLKKYNLTIRDIEYNETKKRCFLFSNEDEKMVIAHVVWSVEPNANVYRIGKQKKAYCDLKPEAYIEIKEKLKFYLQNFNDAKKDFIVAYILKNNLQVNTDDKKNDDKKSIEFNQQSVASMMSVIKQANYINKNRKMIKK